MRRCGRPTSARPGSSSWRSRATARCRLEDAGSQAGQFALAKAIASGDSRLLQKAGLESEIARLERLRAAHLDEQLAIRREIARAGTAIGQAEARITALEQDLQRRQPTRGEAFAMQVEGRGHAERKTAGHALLLALEELARRRRAGRPELAAIGGFPLVAVVERTGAGRQQEPTVKLVLQCTGHTPEIELEAGLTPLGLVARLEHRLGRLDLDLPLERRSLAENERRLADYLPRQGQPFALQAELDHKLHTLAALEAELAADEQARRSLPRLTSGQSHGNPSWVRPSRPPRQQRREPQDRWNEPCGRPTCRTAVLELRLVLGHAHGVTWSFWVSPEGMEFLRRDRPGRGVCAG